MLINFINWETDVPVVLIAVGILLFSFAFYIHWRHIVRRAETAIVALADQLQSTSLSGQSLLDELKTSTEHRTVERVVVDVDKIVRQVRFDGWQETNAGERLIKQALRKTLFKYRLHQDDELFEKYFSYIRLYS